VFNAVTVDGGFGLLTVDGWANFQKIRIATDDLLLPAKLERSEAG
jgi:hypothetical protein